jgi:DNA-binding HxlR family transcriptional regulator
MVRVCRSTCPVAYALDHFGDKWSLIILRDIMFYGKQRNADFAESDEKIATNILAERLVRLQKDGLIKSHRDKDDGRKILYVPTAKALDLIPMMLELSVWSAKYDSNTKAQKENIELIKKDRAGIIKRIRSKFEKEQVKKA